MNLRQYTDRAVAWFAVIAASLTLFVVWAQQTFADDLPGEDALGDTGTVDTGLQSWQLIVGFVLPLLIAVVVKSKYSPAVKSLIMLAASAVATAVTMYLQGDLSADADYVESFLKVAALTIAYYQGIWKPTGVAPTIQHQINEDPGPYPTAAT